MKVYRDIGQSSVRGRLQGSMLVTLLQVAPNTMMQLSISIWNRPFRQASRESIMLEHLGVLESEDLYKSKD